MEYEKRYSPVETIWIANSSSSILNWWDRARGAPYLTLDIETHHGYVTCIGFSHDGNEAFSIPFLVGPGRDYTERGNYYKNVDMILRSKIPKVNQNIKYDWSVLETYGFDVANIIGDTMLMAHTIYPELPKGLDFLNSIYTDLPYYKDEGKKFDPRIHSMDRLLKYNARDALCTWQIWKCQLEDAEALRVKHFYFNHVHPTFFIYKKMDQYGIRVDDTQRKTLISKYEPKLDEICSTINMVAEETINPLSPTQVGKLVYEILKCPKKSHVTPSGKWAYSTDEDSLEDLYVNQVSDSGRKTILRSLIVARKYAKVLQFLRSPISPDGRMRTSYKLHGTETGRTSAGKSIEPFFALGKKNKIEDIECGGSFQTIPKHGYEFGTERIGGELRSIFVPSPGYIFVEGDQAQAEDRIVCVLAQDWAGLEILNKKTFIRNRFGLKDDRHTLTAVLVTSKKFEDITEDDRQNKGKKPRHAGNYNASAGMLAVFTHLPFGECKRIMDKFHSENPKIRGIFHEGIKNQILEKRFLVSPHGRRRDFFGQVNEDTYKVAFANIPQATVSDHNKFTILRRLVLEYPEPFAIPLAESHDSLTFEVRIEHKDAFISKFRMACETPIDFSGCSLSRDYNLIIPGDVKWSDENWMNMK
jgi:DNA polymerase I